MRSIHLGLSSLGLIAVVLSAGCGGGENPPPGTPPPTTSASVAPPTSTAPIGATSAAPGDSAYALLTTATGCWVGTLWGDAEGEVGFAERRAGNERRCGKVVHTMTGSEDAAKAASLRALDPAVTDALLAKVGELAKADKLDDAHAAALKQLGQAVAAAARESVTAHMAARKIHEDIGKLKTDKEREAARDKDATKLSADDATAIVALKGGNALDSLLKLDAGEYSKDAHAIGVLLALGRVRMSRELPRYLKLYAVGPAYTAVFGVPMPAVPDKAGAALKAGTWQTFVVDVAKASGHPVPDTAKTLKEREPLAWAAVLTGFADKLKADQGLIKSPELGEVVNHAIALLETRAEKVVEHAAAKKDDKADKKDDKKK